MNLVKTSTLVGGAAEPHAGPVLGAGCLQGIVKPSGKYCSPQRECLACLLKPILSPISILPYSCWNYRCAPLHQILRGFWMLVCGSQIWFPRNRGVIRFWSPRTWSQRSVFENWCDAWLLLQSLHSVHHQFLQHWAARNHNGTGQMGLPCPGWKWTHFSGIQPCQPAFTHSINHQITRRDLRLINRVLRFHLIDSRLSLYVFFAPKNIKYLKIGHVYGKSSSQVGNIPITDVGTYKTNIRSRKDNGWLRPFGSINMIHSLVKDYLAGVVWKRT